MQPECDVRHRLRDSAPSTCPEQGTSNGYIPDMCRRAGLGQKDRCVIDGMR